MRRKIIRTDLGIRGMSIGDVDNIALNRNGVVGELRRYLTLPDFSLERERIHGYRLVWKDSIPVGEKYFLVLVGGDKRTTAKLRQGSINFIRNTVKLSEDDARRLYKASKGIRYNYNKRVLRTAWKHRSNEIWRSFDYKICRTWVNDNKLQLDLHVPLLRTVSVIVNNLLDDK